jgi:glyoxylase-like metal-dependent hydrolase (beta-lactamase superfamily II)
VPRAASRRRRIEIRQCAPGEAGHRKAARDHVFQQFNLRSLGHASYLVGDERTGRALVFDPRRDVEVYTQAARDAGLRVCYAADSHGHNDYLSGLTELRERTGAQVWGSADAELGYEHEPLKDSQVVEIGDSWIKGGLAAIYTGARGPANAAVAAGHTGALAGERLRSATGIASRSDT